MGNEFDIVVVASKHRPPIITEYLDGLDAVIHWTTDYNLPPGWKPSEFWRPLDIGNYTGTLRNYNGCRDALAKSRRDITLMFEDDARPNRPDWLEVCRKAAGMLDCCDAVCLHGRNPYEPQIEATALGLDYYSLPKRRYERLGEAREYRWSLGSLAYIGWTRKLREAFAPEYSGCGVDILLPNVLHVLLLQPSPFDHDRRHGSLTTNPR